MSCTITSRVIAAKPAGTLRSHSAALVAAIIPVVLLCNAAEAQVAAMATPTPVVGATSPLGMGFGMGPAAAVAPVGIPLGSTEITSSGLSPVPAAATNAAP